MIFWTTFRILRTQAILPKSFGSFGGGGRSGRVIVGKDGSSGRSGISGRAGRRGIDGRTNVAFGADGRESDGREGRRIGTGFTENSGTVIRIPARISCRSRMISGHFGNRITGRSGITALIILKIKYLRS
jgi:hypothetical protein